MKQRYHNWDNLGRMKMEAKTARMDRCILQVANRDINGGNLWAHGFVASFDDCDEAGKALDIVVQCKNLNDALGYLRGSGKLASGKSDLRQVIGHVTGRRDLWVAVAYHTDSATYDPSRWSSRTTGPKSKQRKPLVHYGIATGRYSDIEDNNVADFDTVVKAAESFYYMIAMGSIL